MYPIDWPTHIHSSLDSNPQPHDPPFKGKLTIIWDDEKQAILERFQAFQGRFTMFEEFFTALDQRLDAQNRVTEALAQRVQTLEHHILNLEGSSVSISRN